MPEDQFWLMTPAQFSRRLNAVTEIRKRRMDVERSRVEAAQRRAAWICATIMNYAGKQLPRGKNVKIEDLLKKKKSPDEVARARRLLIKRHRLTERYNIYDD